MSVPVVHATEIVTTSTYCKVEVGHVPEGGGGNFGKYTEGGTTSVARKRYTTKSGNLTFDPGMISTINWKPIGGQVSESIRFPRGEPISDPSKNPTGSSSIPIPEKSC